MNNAKSIIDTTSVTNTQVYKKAFAYFKLDFLTSRKIIDEN